MFFLKLQEESLKEKGEEEYKIQEKKDEVELEDLSEDQRYEKLQDLLNQSKQYSDWLKSKMEQSELERSKELREKQEANKGNKRKNSTGTRSVAKKVKRAERSVNGQTIPDEQPVLISGGVMRKYQLEGLQWMINLDQNGINGILADEMGLGKTLQTISLFAHLVEVGVRVRNYKFDITNYNKVVHSFCFIRNGPTYGNLFSSRKQELLKYFSIFFFLLSSSNFDQILPICHIYKYY